MVWDGKKEGWLMKGVTLKRINWTIQFSVALMCLLFLSLTVFADMGRITTSDVEVREDYQQAIIMHNLEEEVLILGTELVAEDDTTILRFIPFPSEPAISLVKGEPFQVILDLIKRHQLVFITSTKSGTEIASAASVEILLNAKLGVHNVTVIKAGELLEFNQWVADFLESKGLRPGNDYSIIKEVAADYIERGIKYFVFDLVEVTPELQSVNPIAYYFKSNLLYYPLKTSNTFGGTGGINLFIIAPGTLCDPHTGAPLYITEREVYTLYSCMGPLGEKNPDTLQVSTSAKITKEEAEAIYPSAGDLFAESKSIFLQLICYTGEYSFEDDILP